MLTPIEKFEPGQVWVTDDEDSALYLLGDDGEALPHWRCLVLWSGSREPYLINVWSIGELKTLCKRIA